MIDYYADVLACMLVVIVELFIILAFALALQGILYRFFSINLYKTFFKWLDRLEKYIERKFDGR